MTMNKKGTYSREDQHAHSNSHPNNCLPPRHSHINRNRLLHIPINRPTQTQCPPKSHFVYHQLLQQSRGKVASKAHASQLTLVQGPAHEVQCCTVVHPCTCLSIRIWHRFTHDSYQMPCFLALKMAWILSLTMWSILALLMPLFLIQL